MPVMLKTRLPDWFGYSKDDPANRQFVRLDAIRLVRPYFGHNAIVLVDGMSGEFEVDLSVEDVVAKIEEHAHAE